MRSKRLLILCALALAACGGGGGDTPAPVPQPGIVAFSSASYLADENAGSKTITVRRLGGADGAVSVDYASADGSAIAGRDYTAAAGTLRWADGEVADKTFEIALADDDAVNGNRQLLLRLSSAGGGAMLGVPAEATLTIRDDEVPPAPYGLDTRPSLQGLNFPDTPPDDTGLIVERAFAQLSFAQPVYLTAAPGDNSQLYVVQQGGLIRRFANDPAAASAPVFLDLTDRVLFDGEQGLLGLAFDPDYADNRYLYVYYSADNPRRSVIARYTARADRQSTDPASEQILLSFNQPYSNHNGGMIAFGPDERLYIASGDGGRGNDPQNNAQNLGVLLGKLLRINTDGSIPADNPFVGTAGARGEIWAYGLRNPYRFSFDRVTGELWLGDVGQGALEEIDLITRGGNYGWRVFEGTRLNFPNDPRPANAIPPVFVYDRNAGKSITGGFVYRGNRVPALRGAYVYGDFVSGALWALRYDGTQVSSNTPIGNAGFSNPSGFGESADGELYVLSYGGGIYRFAQSTGGGAALPQKLSDTGLFTDTAALTPNPGLIEYRISAPFWSDGATKRRWIGVPDDRTIRFSGSGAWDYPAGSVIVKHFELPVSAETTTRLETRVMVRYSSGWQGYTYRWNSAQTDADLLPGSATGDYPVAADAPGGARTQTWYFPSRGDCFACHTAVAGFVLGPDDTAQMNRDFAYANASDNQLRTYNHIGLFDSDIGDAESYARRADPAGDAPLAQRARAYLDSNCAQCHRPGGTAPTNIDLRADTPIADTRTRDVPPSSGDLGLANARIIAPGNKAASVLWERMRVLDENRMPPLASHRVDAEGLTLIGDWIDAGANQ